MPPLKLGSSPRARRRSPVGSNKNRNTSRKCDESFSPGIFGNGLPFPDFSSSSHLKPPTPKSKQQPIEPAFEDHLMMGKRISKSLYFHKLPSTPRSSLPLTVLAVRSFTNEVFGNSDTLEFLDLEMASEIGRNACVSPTALIMALVYLERLSTHNPNYLNTVKPSELFVVSLLVASKFIQDDGEDCGVYNDEWATSSKMDLRQINRLELQFLDAINWSVNVTRDEFDKVLLRVEQKLALNQGLRRGWFTYTEIGSLSELIFTWSLIGPIIRDYILQVLAVASMTYTCMITTVLSSSFLGPKIFALTKTMLLSSSIFHSSGNHLSTQLGSMCPGFTNNVTGFNNNAMPKLPSHTYYRQQQKQIISDEAELEAQVMLLENVLDEGGETNDTELTQQLLSRLNIDRLASIISQQQQQRYKKDNQMNTDYHRHHPGFNNPVGTLSLQNPNHYNNRYGADNNMNKNPVEKYEEEERRKISTTQVENDNLRLKIQEQLFKTTKPWSFCDDNSASKCNTKFASSHHAPNLWNSGNSLEFSNYIKV